MNIQKNIKNIQKNIKNRTKMVLLLCILILLVFLFFYFKSQREDFAVPTDHERPFVNVFGVKNDKRDQLSIILLSHPFTRDSSYKQYEEYKRDKFLVLGIASYSEFPKITSNKLDSIHNPKDKAWSYDYMKVVDGWLHCFREPDKFIDKGVNKLLLSESDFCDYNLYKPDSNIKKEYDFIYLCPKDDEKDEKKNKDCHGWVAQNKNWKLAYECLKVMCGKYKLKGVLVGRYGCELPEECDGLIETTKFLSRDELLEKYRKSKFIFVPNQVDASPRVLTEGLCVNLPVLVNQKLLGGWKYVNDKTGAFFNDVNDIGKSIEYIQNNYDKLEPRDNFIKNFSKKVTGKKFKDFIQKNYSDQVDVSEYDYLDL